MAIFFDYIKGQSTGLKNTLIKFKDNTLPYITVDSTDYGKIITENGQHTFCNPIIFNQGLTILGGQKLTNLGIIEGGKISGSTIENSTIQNTPISNSTITNSIIQSPNKSVNLQALDNGITIAGNINVSSGNVFAQTFYAQSDARLKDNIKDCDYGLDIIQKIKVKEYNFKNDKNKSVGCIAQELDEILPKELKDSIVAKGNYLAINDSKLIYFLINAVKELKQEIDMLKQ